MGAIRNAKRANAKTHAIPKSGKRGPERSKHQHQHTGGKAHAHTGGRDPHEHETSAQRFARRYPDGQPFGAKDNGQGNGQPPEHPDGPTARDGWPMRYVVAAVLIALIFGLALIAVFTPTGETATIAPEPTARIVHQPYRAPAATATPDATSTPVSTPCPAPTLPYCETPPTEQTRPPESGATMATPEPTPTGPTVGGALVPRGLRCQEDEIIGFVGVDTLGCVHVEGRTLEPLNPDTY